MGLMGCMSNIFSSTEGCFHSNVVADMHFFHCGSQSKTTLSPSATELLLHIRGYFPILFLSVCSSTFMPCISTASKSACNKDWDHEFQRNLMCTFNASIWTIQMSLNIFSPFKDNGMQGLTLCFTGLVHTAYSKSTSAGSAQLLLLPKTYNCHSCYSLN